MSAKIVGYQIPAEPAVMWLVCRFHVPDVDKACARFEELGVEFVKKPDAGNMKGLAFIKVKLLLQHLMHQALLHGHSTV